MTATPIRGDRVSASVFVAAPPAIAFEVFTAQIDQWWRHGMKFRAGGRGCSVLHLEPRLGGRLFETISAAQDPGGPGHVRQTGTVTAWDPPRALQIEWRGANFAPHESTTVSVTFFSNPAPNSDSSCAGVHSLMPLVRLAIWADVIL